MREATASARRQRDSYLDIAAKDRKFDYTTPRIEGWVGPVERIGWFRLTPSGSFSPC